MLGMDTQQAHPVQLEPLLSVRELSDYLGVPIATIYDWRVDGKGPPGIRVGRRVMFFVADIDEWIRSRRETGGEP